MKKIKNTALKLIAGVFIMAAGATGLSCQHHSADDNTTNGMGDSTMHNTGVSDSYSNTGSGSNNSIDTSRTSGRTDSTMR